MGTRKKSWEEKLNNGAKPEVKELGKAFGGFPVGAKMLIPTPLQFDQYVREIPAGEVRDAKSIRAELASRFDAETTCPVCTGLFLRIVAENALEKLESGTPKDQIAPFWRAIPADSPLAVKLSCGSETLKSFQQLDTISR
jgi:hypothetical protein